MCLFQLVLAGARTTTDTTLVLIILNVLLKKLLDLKSKQNMKLNKTLLITTEDKLFHNASSKCHICDKGCINKVRDYCHKRGKNRGTACKICNLNYQDHIFIPVVF